LDPSVRALAASVEAFWSAAELVAIWGKFFERFWPFERAIFLGNSQITNLEGFLRAEGIDLDLR
jgi:hypothetical protein